MRNYIIRISVMALAMALTSGIITSGAWGASQEITREELVDLYNKARTAILNVDPAAFEQVVLPAKPDAEKLTAKELTEAKGFIDTIFPDLAKTRFRRFLQGGEEALFVVQTDLDDKETVSLSVFRFKKKNGRWMLFAKFFGKSFSSHGPEKDEESIKKALAHDPAFKLLAESGTKPGASKAKAGKAGLTGSGFLTVAQKTYNFAHAFAFKRKALGYDNKINTLVVLTEEAIPAEAVKARLREKNDWSEFVNHLILTFDPELKPEYLSFWVSHESTSNSSPPHYVKSQVALENGRVKGWVRMEKPKKLFGDTYIFDVKFDAPIIVK